MIIACSYCRRLNDKVGNCEGCGATLPLPDYFKPVPYCITNGGGPLGSSAYITYTTVPSSIYYSNGFNSDYSDVGYHNKKLGRK